MSPTESLSSQTIWHYRLIEKLGGGIDFVCKAENVKHVVADKEVSS